MLKPDMHNDNIQQSTTAFDIHETTDKNKKDINTILINNTIVLPKERYSSIDYIMTFSEWEIKKVFSSHVKFSPKAIEKMKADPFMTYQQNGENVVFFGDEIELAGVFYPSIEYEIQKNELSYIIYDDKRIFDKNQVSWDAEIYQIQTEEEGK